MVGIHDEAKSAAVKLFELKVIGIPSMALESIIPDVAMLAGILVIVAMTQMRGTETMRECEL